MSRHIAVLGGGLTGLSSAFHLSRRFPKARVTLIERQKQLGGWVRSERIKLPGKDASVVLEAGPRTLRPNANSVLELINLLGLKDQVLTVPKSSEAAKSRYLYVPPAYGDSISGLQRIPTSILSALRSPLTRILGPAVLQEVFKFNNKPDGLKDESVDAFLRRRFGDDFAQVFGSALIHGIYAADSRKIGIRSAFPGMWDAAEHGWGSLIRGELMPGQKPAQQDYETGDIVQLMSGVSVYSFKDGLQVLTNALEKHLVKQGKVEILRGATVSSIDIQSAKVEVNLEDGTSLLPSHVTSALPTHLLYRALSPSLRSLKPFDHMLANPTSSVHVVNIVFPGPPSTIHPAGFGYLIPRPPQGYPSTSDEVPSILGTVFDACSLGAQDTTSSGKFGYTDAEFTKLTVMVGGPYPLPKLPSQLSSENDTGTPGYIQNILKQLSTHLSRTLPAPIYWRIQPNEDCIPTLLPGHGERMMELRSMLAEKFGGRLQVVGAGVGGVSVGDCVEAGRKAALEAPSD
ncbi:protoporphyrinogen oxidase [Ephemerocybe angulata]|uniref:Protoporphyrinogen oxidase n=1 Tax=Ephemerocybe angulata TaxID=980116 RepID=A0A8H6LYR8_9AGAR|nr:protoporphyrinogen oxidase [Tulosesus angulatus]